MLGPQRVLMLNHNLRNDGTFFRSFPMAQELARRGHAVTMLTVSRERRFTTRWSQSEGVKLGETPNLRPECGATGYGLLDNLARLRIACAGKFDIIHMFDHKPNATLAGFLARTLHDVPLVSDWADWWAGSPGAINDVPHRFPLLHRWEEWWEIRSKTAANAVMTISEVLKERAESHGCSPDLVGYVPTGAPLQRIYPVDKLAARSRLGFSAELKLLGYVGISQADLEILFATLACLPDIHLLLIGPVIPEVQKTAESLGVAERIFFAGRIHGPELNDYLGSTDVLCLPMKDNAYNRGRLPNKLLDYLAAGRPVVACPVGDVKWILGREKVGRLASAEGFPESIRELLDNPEAGVELGRAARRLAETEFDWSRLILQVEDLYEKALEARRSRR